MFLHFLDFSFLFQNYKVFHENSEILFTDFKIRPTVPIEYTVILFWPKFVYNGRMQAV
jgi:hypothetical protein